MKIEKKLWQKEIVERYKDISNADLLDEVFSQASGDDWDGCFTDRGQWEYNYLTSLLRERLADWLKE